MIENNFCIHNPTPTPHAPPLICQGGDMGKKQHLLKRLEMTLSALLDHVFLCVTDEQSRHPPLFCKGGGLCGNNNMYFSKMRPSLGC